MVPAGRTQQLTAIGTFSDGTTLDLTTQVVWLSDNEATAQIANAAGSNGLATTLAMGQATLSAALEGVRGATTVTVTQPVLVSIAITPAAPSVPSGLTQQLAAIGTFSDSSTQDLTASVTWSSDTEAVAQISNEAGSSGLSTTLAMGAATISASFEGIRGTATLTVIDPVLVSLEVTPGAPSLTVSQTPQFAATGTMSDRSTQDDDPGELGLEQQVRGQDLQRVQHQG